MAKITENVLTLVGKSEREYKFHIYSKDEECADESGIYVFIRRYRDKNVYRHQVIYIGRAMSFQMRFYAHHKEQCISQNGANCLCLLQEANERERERIETDLLANYNTLCNDVNN